jgi:hypothetical protein
VATNTQRIETLDSDGEKRHAEVMAGLDGITGLVLENKATLGEHRGRLDIMKALDEDRSKRSVTTGAFPARPQVDKRSAGIGAGIATGGYVVIEVIRWLIESGFFKLVRP